MMQKIPTKNNLGLKYSNVAPGVVKSLQNLKRTGWVRRGVKNPETVQEHIVACRNLVIEEIPNLDFSEKEAEEILDMLEVHDWPESDPRVGDLVILKDEINKENLKKEKSRLELEAMTKICEKIGDKGRKILELWKKFENGQNPPSSFARQVDKLQAMEKAFEYEKAGEKVSTKEFIDQHKEKIVHPVLLNRLRALYLKLPKVII